MKRFKLAMIVGSLGLVIAILHYLAINLFLYWDIFWLDMLMHFLGGAWVALLGFWILDFLFNKGRFNSVDGFLISICFVLLVGILWEVFEFYAGLTFNGLIPVRDMWTDTIQDLVLDVVGGIFGAILVFRMYNRG